MLQMLPACLPFTCHADIPKYMNGKSISFKQERLNAQWGQLLGLKEMYLRAPNAKWYWIGGCDNYVHHDYVLKRLQDFDHTKPLWLAQFVNLDPTVPGKVNMHMKNWPKYNGVNINGKLGQLIKEKRYQWTSGGKGTI
jgi:hypothetical protein